MRPSLDKACEVYHASNQLWSTSIETGNRLKGSARKNGVYASATALQRAAAALGLLAEVGIDRAVAAGHESVMVGAA